MTLLFITEGKFCSVSRCYICTDLTPFSSPPQVVFTGGGAGREKVERLFEFQAPRREKGRMMPHGSLSSDRCGVSGGSRFQWSGVISPRYLPCLPRSDPKSALGHRWPATAVASSAPSAARKCSLERCSHSLVWQGMCTRALQRPTKALVSNPPPHCRVCSPRVLGLGSLGSRQLSWFC